MALARSLNSTATAAVARCVFSLKRLDGLCRVIHAWKARLARSQLHSLNVITKDPQNIQGTRPLNFWATQTGQQIYWHWPAALRDSLNCYIPKKRIWRWWPFRWCHRKYFWKNLFPQFVKQKNKRRAHSFSYSNSFPSFCLFLFIYLFLHFSFFFFLLNGARKHQTLWWLFDVFCRWCTRIPLHLLPFSFTLHATLRHPQLHVGQGKRPQKTKTKPTK